MKATAWNTGWLFRHLDSQENFVPVTIPHDAMQAEPRTEGYYKKRPCAELCALAADLLEDYLKNIT